MKVGLEIKRRGPQNVERAYKKKNAVRGTTDDPDAYNWRK